MSFTKQIFYILGTDAILEGLQLLVKSFIAVLLGPTVFGLLVLVQLIPQYAEKLFRIGVDEGSTYVASQHPKEEGVVFFNTALLVGIFGLIAIGVFLCVKSAFFHYVLKDTSIDEKVLIPVLISIPLIFWFRAFTKNLMYTENILPYNLITFGTPLLAQIFILMTLKILGGNLFYLVLAPAIAYGLGGMLAAIVLYCNGFLVPCWRIKVQGELIRYGFRTYLPVAIQFIQFRIDVLLIGIFLTPTEVGLYTLAATFAQILYKLPSTIAGLLYPKAAKQVFQEKAASLTVNTCRHSFLLMVIFFIPFIFGVAGVIHFFMKKYIPILPSFYILAFAWSIVGISQIFHSYFLGRGYPNVSLGVFSIGLVVNLVLNLFLIPAMGIVGASLASLASYSVCSGLFSTQFIKKGGYYWGELFLPQVGDFGAYKKILKWI